MVRRCALSAKDCGVNLRMCVVQAIVYVCVCDRMKCKKTNGRVLNTYGNDPNINLPFVAVSSFAHFFCVYKV